MADDEKPKQTLLIQGSEFTIENSPQQMILGGNGPNENEDIDDEILQQTFGEVSQPLGQNGGFKDENGENVTLIADGSVLTDVSGNVVGTINDDGSTYTLSSTLNISEGVLTGTNNIIEGSTSSDADPSSTVALTVSSGNEALTKSQEILRGELSTGKVLELPATTNTFSGNQPLFVIRSPANSTSTSAENPGSGVLSSLVKYTPTTLNTLNTQVGPLGSSQNPIRIIQQGNQYTSTQQLNPDQLSQIMQVVQQQQAVRQAKQMGGTSVIYNPETQTKIVYRVINPADLHTKTPDVNISSLKSVQVGASGKTYTGKKRGRKRKIDLKKGDEDTEGPELSRKEKEDKKKNRPKTRSGRVSKPPRHMIKDYKQIHLVDWHEDYDDSDGGYSDYKASGDDENAERRRAEEEDDYEKLRPKRFACGGCDRRYIGSGGLRRHWSNFPDHKTFSKIAEGIADAERIDKDEIPTDAEASNDSFAHSFKDLDTKNLVNGDNNMEAGDSQNAVVMIQSEAERRADLTQSKEVVRGEGDGRHTPVQNTAGRGRMWGRNSRRFKLMDLLERCSDEVILDVARPRLAKVCSVWDFLVSKAQAEKQAEEDSQREMEEDEEDDEEEGEAQVKLNFRDVYQQYEQLRVKVKQLCAECKVTQEEAGRLTNSGECRVSSNSVDSVQSAVGPNQESSKGKGEEPSDTIVFEFSGPESAGSLGEQCAMFTMTSELPEHYTDMPAPVSSHTKFKPTQEKFISPGPGSMRKSKPKLYPGAISVIPPLETGSKPRILGESKPLEESEIRAEMYAKKPSNSRLKLWVKDEDTLDEEDDFTFLGMKKEKKVTYSRVTGATEEMPRKLVTTGKETSYNMVVTSGVTFNTSHANKHSACELPSNNTAEVKIPQTLPESIYKAKNTTDFQYSLDTSSGQRVGTNITATVHSKPILSVGDTIRTSSGEIYNTSLDVENTQAVLTDENIQLKRGSKHVDCNNVSEYKTTSFKNSLLENAESLSSVENLPVSSKSAPLVTNTSADTKYKVFLLQDDETSQNKNATDLTINESMTPVILNNEHDNQETSGPKPIVTMTQRAQAVDNTETQDAMSSVRPSSATTVNEDMRSDSTKYKIHIQDGPTIEGESPTDALDTSMMDIDQGAVVQSMIDGDKEDHAMLTLDTKDHTITSDIGTFISDPPPALEEVEQEDAKLQTIQLLPDLSQNTGLPDHSQAAFHEPVDSTSGTVAYQVIGEDLGRYESSDMKAVHQVSDPEAAQQNVQVLEGLQVIQTGDGIVLVKNPDGTFQLHNPHNQPIPLETVQALINLTPS